LKISKGKFPQKIKFPDRELVVSLHHDSKQMDRIFAKST